MFKAQTTAGWAALVVAGVLGLRPSTAGGETYYVSNQGNDDNDGRSPTKPWRTIARVKAQAFKPGDVVLLERGDAWREQLVPSSGSEQGYVRYGAYGTGEKPLLLGSVEKNDPSDWRHEGGNIWATVEPAAGGSEVLKNASFEKDAAHWHLYCEKGGEASSARDTEAHHSAPASYRVHCVKSGGTGSDIQLYTTEMSITRGKLYRLQFYAKATKPFALNMPHLMKSGPPWTGYSSGPRTGRKPIKSTWQRYVQFHRANVTASDARLTFALGGALPEGATLHVDSLSFAECADDRALTRDVGNIIFDGEASCGVKVWKPSDLNAQGEYWYDEDAHVLKLYSARCPASHYSDIECAIREHVIDQSGKHYVIYENLAVKYGAAHGVGGGSTHHIIVRDCDFGYIGGGDQRGGEHTVRFGNGVEFWASAHDCLVERCRLWEVYDAALTNQSNAPRTRQVNITYRNNLIWNCEYSFEYWNRPENSETTNVRFVNNTCLSAGHGWGHAQRPDPSGRHLCFYTSPAKARDIIIRNNVFYEAKTNAFFVHHWSPEAIRALRMDGNCWYQAAGSMIRFYHKDKAKDRGYSMAQFDAYRREWGQEPHSITARPMLTDAAKGDFRLKPGSPCIDAGVTVEHTSDYAGARVPQGRAPDIGAYESPPR